MTEIRLDITRYTATAYPDPDSINAGSYEVEVEYKGRGRWAVCRNRRCYDRDGKPDWEPIPSDREEKWLARYRFGSAEEAIEVAKKVAPAIVVNGLTAEAAWRLEVDRAWH